MATIDMTKMPIAAGLGISGAVASNQIRKNRVILKGMIAVEIDYATYAKIFTAVTDEGRNSCSGAANIANRFGVSIYTAQAILDEIAAGTLDLSTKEGW